MIRVHIELYSVRLLAEMHSNGVWHSFLNDILSIYYFCSFNFNAVQEIGQITALIRCGTDWAAG